jgi:hypothetical protein
MWLSAGTISPGYEVGGWRFIIMKPWELFLEHYRAFGAAPTVESYVALFEQGATLHPGMAELIRIDQIPDFIARTLTRMPEFRFTPIRWSFGHDTIFVEARNTAVAAGKPIEWPSVYCITLRGDRVLRGRAYYDRAEVLSHFEPVLTRDTNDAHARLLEGVRPGGASSCAPDVEEETYERVIKPYAENWRHPDPKSFEEFYRHDARMINPGFERPLIRGELAEYYTGLLAQAPNLRLQLEQWAASPGLLFCEWLATGDFNGHPMKLRLVDRYTLADFQITEGVAYFDGLALRALMDPNVARFRDISVSVLSASI